MGNTNVLVRITFTDGSVNERYDTGDPDKVIESVIEMAGNGQPVVLGGHSGSLIVNFTNVRMMYVRH